MALVCTRAGPPSVSPSSSPTRCRAAAATAPVDRRLRRPDHLHGHAQHAARHRQLQGRPGKRPGRRGASCRSLRRPARRTTASTSTTRARRVHLRASPMRCARSTWRSTKPACWSRSTTPSWPTCTTHLSRRSPEHYRKWAQLRIDALNHALQGIPEDRVRYHVCFGSWHAPHVADAPLEALVDLILQVKAGAYSIEAANPRHEHEWRVWEETKLPDGQSLIPGVITHHMITVEHPAPDRRPHRPLRQAGRARERHRRHGLRLRSRARASSASTRR